MSTPDQGINASADTTTEEPTQDELKITPVVPLHQVPDFNLAAITHISHFVGFPLTLYMPWGIASGNAAAPNDYYKHLAESTRGGNVPAGTPEDWVEAIDDFAKRHFDPYTEMSYADRMERAYQGGWDLTAFLNLKDVRCWIGGAQQPVLHDYLRVRLSDVTAWSWGAVT